MYNSYDPAYSQTGQSWYSPATSNPSGWQHQLNTNVIYVTSLEEALIKTNMRNSDMIYFNQNKNEFYRIKVDMEGRKSWAAFPYSSPDSEDNTPATKADILALSARIEELEAAKETKIATKNIRKKELTDNVESNG